jgi:CheY-like chemotaxis protein
VQDTGPGIPPEIIQRIFEPYFTTKETGKGTGLGLPTVMAIVKSHGGGIVLESNIGQGTAFTIYFPALQAVEPDMPSPREGIVQSGVGRILFVDDEQPLAELGKAFVERLGYQATAVTDSSEALEIFRSQPQEFDLVVTDLTMPKLTGIDLAREVKIIRPDMPIILCTGYAERVSQGMAKELGIQEVIIKPFKLQQLGQILNKILESKKNSDERPGQ